MATVHNNPIVNGLSGMLGQSIVFRSYNGRTFISNRPQPSRKQSEGQKTNRSKFRMASHWAQVILQDPERKTYYQKKAKELKLPNAYTAAITDYMRKPRLKKTPREDGSMMCQVSKKDFELKNVEVVLIKTGMTEKRTLEKNKQNKYMFFLNKEEQQADLYIDTIDYCEQMIQITT